MGWRDDYKVHPAADVFPMMPDEDLHKLGEDIKTNGLKHPLIFEAPEEGEEAPLKDTLLDGRNRLAAMELVGIEVRGFDKHYYKGDPVAHIIGLNIHRRHLTKQEQADLIVVAIKAGKASRQVGEVPRHVKGKAGSEKDAAKAKAVETAKEYGISKRVVERSIAKS